MFGGSFGVRISDIVKFGLWVLVEASCLRKKRYEQVDCFPSQAKGCAGEFTHGDGVCRVALDISMSCDTLSVMVEFDVSDTADTR